MSNNFLPFVTSESDDLYIYTSLIQRTKGVHYHKIANLLTIVLSVGQEEIRKYAKELPDINQDEMYNQIINKYDTYKIDEVILKKFLSLERFFKDATYRNDKDSTVFDKCLENISIEMSLLFLACVSYLKKDTSIYSECDFKLLINEWDDINLDIKKYADFDNSKKIKLFSGERDLMAYIAFCAITHETKKYKRPEPVFALFDKEKSDDTAQ